MENQESHHQGLGLIRGKLVNLPHIVKQQPLKDVSKTEEVFSQSQHDYRYVGDWKTEEVYSQSQHDYRYVGDWKTEEVYSQSQHDYDSDWKTEETVTCGIGAKRKSSSKGQRELQNWNCPVRSANKRTESFRVLMNLTTYSPDEVVQQLIQLGSGFSTLLQEADISPDNFDLMIKVLAHATLADSNRDKMYHLFNKICEDKFVDKLVKHAVTIKRKYPDKAQDYFANLLQFLECYAGAMITVAVVTLTHSVDVLLEILKYLEPKNYVSVDLVKQCEDLLEMLDDAYKHWENRQKLGQRKNADDFSFPPEDFRSIDVLPTLLDIFQIDRPFLRKSIVKGKYMNGHHYLDVQFRLLREDFVRPLRIGINDLLKDSVNRGRGVRIYRGVTICGPAVNRSNIYHTVKIHAQTAINYENSKQLLFGNLLCFSNDNFQTFLLGSVAERNPSKLKDGFLGVKFECDLDDQDALGDFVMIESRAYFMAYKHVLTALQKIPDNAIPMEPYIVHVQEDIDLPQYLNYKQNVKYELPVVKRSNLDHWKTVPIHNDLPEWPTGSVLGLDDSQLRAFKNALTRQFAIIQGPPGTGKTYLGLKIVKTLLHNSSVWAAESTGAPILVVCYTNHALDQFLEGIQAFTKDIVRVGSRTKSGQISRYQIKFLAEYKHEDRKRHLEDELDSLRGKIMYNSFLNDIFSSMDGVIWLNLLMEAKVIPKQIIFQLCKSTTKTKLTDWLFNSVKPETLNTLPNNPIFPLEKSTAQQMSTKNVESKSSVQTKEMRMSNLYEDVEKLREMEEQDRVLEDDLDVSPPSWLEKYKIYELRDKDLIEEMNVIKANVDDTNAKFKCEIISSQRELLRIGLSIAEVHVEMQELENQPDLDIWKLDIPRRWQLYKYWVQKLTDKTRTKLSTLSDAYKKLLTDLDVIKNEVYLGLMQKASVVGMTTTGAAQHSNLLQVLAPPIVVVEEAAEILEAHVLTSLSAKCQHLIMIGDHQQLRPSATVYELAIKYGLETSLFERMIKNGLAYDTLEYQHRMRPTISKLLIPSVYPDLKNHPSVHKFPNIIGITKNIFFISHQINEREDADDNRSHENLHEAEFLICLCRHLILQGYSHQNITILTPYSGQFFLLRRLQREIEECSGVRICVVDSFQGEENKIILLSLVRSNEEGKVGFLETENRVCVALSRAQHGLYITGNMNQLSASSKLWKTIQSDLTDMECIGDSLTLKCHNHPDQEMRVTTGQDFFMKSPRGGCQQLCGKSLPYCKHSCSKPCHYDDLFGPETHKCKQLCSKVLCKLGHLCPKPCDECQLSDACDPCTELVLKKLPCHHKHKLQCNISPERYECPTPVMRELPHCQHMANMLCHEHPEKVSCSLDCETWLNCGHKCRQKCHMKQDPDHNEYDCQENCTRSNAGCSQNHPCQKKCYEECGACTYKVSKTLPCLHKVDGVECSQPVETITCPKKCRKTLACGHPCKKMCYQECGDCLVKVKKTVPVCNHICWVECYKPATSDHCDGLCPKLLDCGHPCTGLCRESCTEQCNEMVKSDVGVCPNGHTFNVPCYLVNKGEGETGDVWLYCQEPCNTTLKCGHRCVGNCGRCFQGRLHVSCTSPCREHLVCGHECKQPCIANCTPCQESCQWNCGHNRCDKACAVLCKPCKEPCPRKCEHQKCNKQCGEMCLKPPCEQPCKKKLDKCSHPCIGLCGDPCPPLCRQCDKEELFGVMEEETSDDTRFVLLEDCGHIIEAQTLKNLMEEATSTIGFKKCPKCRQTIFSNRRYHSVIINTYEVARKVKTKYNTSTKKYSITRKSIELVLQDRLLQLHYSSRAKKPVSALGIVEKGRPRIQKYLGDGELRLIMFQSQVLKKAATILHFYENQDRFVPTTGSGYNIQLLSREPQQQQYENLLKANIDRVLDRVMNESHAIAPQTMQEVSCEMQRVMMLPSYWKFLEKCSSCKDERLSNIKEELHELNNPTVVFCEEREKKFSKLMKEAENSLGSVEICDSKRVGVLKAVGLREATANDR
ncbi:hypothetical protein Pmani_029078 [Petrolisthes manimaculis]|uniref:NF-X1-type domain-containing protein n=1 Tax=Petrolisthes manimaculis TaxID=1843537 RepID=A0AAE1P0Q3_9EUCA|nr:hypothetical protein Pmani_029078 [Petrolisthes manimaculis]